ncbi:MAG: TolC family protein [Desulfopila sp.]|jgi:outer membrane protein TolC|nr:TolC family protein [Desulfopila sp.]
MKMSLVDRIFLFCCVCIIAAATGCAPVDQWHVFQAEQEPHLSIESDEGEISTVEIGIGQEKNISLQQSDFFVPEDLSLEEAVMLALQHNGDLRVQQITPVITGAFEQIERGAYDAELFAEGRYSRNNDDAAVFSVNERDESDRAVSLSAGIRQELPSGTSLEVSVNQLTRERDSGWEEDEARLQLSMTQSLLRGFGSTVNMAKVRIAEADTLASIEELKGFINSLLADVEIAYWRYVLAVEEIRIFEESLAVARKQREEIELSIEVGLLPEFEAAAARAEEALRIQALVTAEGILEENRLHLLNLISPGSERPDGHFLRAVSEPRLDPKEISDLEDRLQLALKFRPDLGEARLRLRRNSLETIMTRNGLLPRLDFFITLGKTGYGDSFPDSFRTLDSDSYELSAGLQLSRFLDNRAARARNLASFAARRQAEEAVANLRRIVRLDVRLAVNEVERQRRLIDASRATRRYQEQTSVAEKEKFDVGSSTALLVTQAQRDLLRTQIAEAEAIINYRIALVRLYLAEGSLLMRRGVQLDEGALAALRMQ